MCDSCGCNEHAHTHDHDHSHGHDHTHIELQTPILARNDYFAQQNRHWLTERNVVAINLISSPGSGKTTLLEATLDTIAADIPCAVLTGDQRTDRDAKRLTGRGAPVHQIETYDACHLNGEQVHHLLDHAVPPGTRLLFIENVGNLVCPSAFDLGETCKVALLSVTEGEDKPIKYPTLFQRTSAAILTKTDLLPHLDWDLELCKSYIQAVNPGLTTIPLSAKTGDNMELWIHYLTDLIAAE
jgi:hydrogenase nickel incorporation protein HypB